MSSIHIKNARIINEDRDFKGDILVKDEYIVAVGNMDSVVIPGDALVINADNLILIPGVIDEHVHFRDPGLTHKGDIYSESSAAVAGGVTSFMDMPNTKPQATAISILNEKYKAASEQSFANYSFYLGATNTNLDEIMKADPAGVCGIKLFMGSSTGNMIVDEEKAMRELFARAAIPIAAHCEDDGIIKRNADLYREKYGNDVPVSLHPKIRSREACITSSSHAVTLAREYNTRLHILHLSTADELKLFRNDLPVEEKRITAEACVHHLWFDDTAYDTLGTLVKWNPAIKTPYDRDALQKALNNNIIDVVATDHAPHTLEEKKNNYFSAPSGGPFIQHSLITMLELWHRNIISINKIVELMCHNPSRIFNIKERGFIREGYKADLCLIDPSRRYTVTKNNILYKCGWSPLEGSIFSSTIVKTIINGSVVWDDGRINRDFRGQKLEFVR
jgi:dihydroorotase